MTCEKGAELYIKYDTDSAYIHIAHISPCSRNVLKTYVYPKCCERFSLKLKGEGDACIYGIYTECEEVYRGE